MSNTIKIKQIDQTQLAAFVNDILDGTGAVYTANRALVTDGAGDVTTSSVTATELGYLSGVTSAIQTQFNNLGSTYLALAGGTMTGALTLDAASLLKFGGATASYPALKRSGTELQVRLADDSGYAPIAASSIVLNVPTSWGPVWTLGSTSGEGYGLSLNTNGYGMAFVVRGSGPTGPMLAEGMGVGNLYVASRVGWGQDMTIGREPGSSTHTYIFGESSGVLGQRNSTNAQTFRVYGTYTDSSNYVRASLAATSTTVTLAAETAGTGADNIDLNLVPAGTGQTVVTNLYAHREFNYNGKLIQATALDGRTITFGSDSAGYPALMFGTDLTTNVESTGKIYGQSGTIEIIAATAARFYTRILSGYPTKFYVGLSGDVVSRVSFGLCDSTADAWLDGADVILTRDAADVLALRRSTNAQTFRVYGTYTDSSNYVRASLAATSTSVTLSAETAGTGADNVDVYVTPAGSGLVQLGAGANKATVDQFGQVTASGGGTLTSNTSGSFGAFQVCWGNGEGIGYGGTIFRSGFRLTWSQYGNQAQAGHEDTGLARNAAGVVEVNNGTLGTYRDIKARNFYFGDSAYFIFNGSRTYSSHNLVAPAIVVGYVEPIDVILERDASAILALRNSTNAQTFRVYGTYTDASNFVRASLGATSTSVTLAAETAGTGADDVDVNITPAGNGKLIVKSSGTILQEWHNSGGTVLARLRNTSNWGVIELSSNGQLVIQDDSGNSNGIYFSGASTVGVSSNFRAGGSITIGGATGGAAGAYLIYSATPEPRLHTGVALHISYYEAQYSGTHDLLRFGWHSGSSQYAPTYVAYSAITENSGTGDYGLAMSTSAGMVRSEKLRITSAGLVTFGGITSSYPALKRSSTELQVRLADDSGYAPLRAGAVYAEGGVATGFGSGITVGYGVVSINGGQFIFDLAGSYDLRIGGSTRLQWTPGGNWSGYQDTELGRAGVGTLGIWNKDNLGCALKVHGTYTDGSNYVRASLAATSTSVTLAAQTAGTGADDVDVNVTAAGNGGIVLNTEYRVALNGSSPSSHYAIVAPGVNVRFTQDAVGSYTQRGFAIATDGGWRFAVGDNTANKNIGIQSDYLLGWVSGNVTATNPTLDTGLGRNAAGVVEVNNGTSGTYRDLRLRTVTVDAADGNGLQFNGGGSVEAYSNYLTLTSPYTGFAFYSPQVGANVLTTDNTTLDIALHTRIASNKAIYFTSGGEISAASNVLNIKAYTSFVLSTTGGSTRRVAEISNTGELYGFYSYTDGSNYQGYKLTSGATSVTLSAETAGTGADNIDLILSPAGTGKVGIGTQSPNETLDILGNLRVSYNASNGAVFSTPSGALHISGVGFGNGIRFGDYVAPSGDEATSLGTTSQSIKWLYLYSKDGFFTGSVGIGTTVPTHLLSLGGNSARTIWMERHTTSDTAGNNLTVQAGSATSGATNKAGGYLDLLGGISTGTGESGVRIKGYVAGSSGTSDTSASTMIEVLGNKVGFFGVTPVVRQTTGIAAATFVANTSAIADDTATWGGYTAGQIVTALKNVGILT